jgi:iron complex outermembrane receptor protein
MTRTGSKVLAYLAGASAAAMLQGASAQAQTAAPAAGRATAVQEIIVTARKRQESILNVPVVETAITQEQLNRAHVTNMQDIQRLAPGLQLGHTAGPVGMLVSIRGVGSISQDQGVDTSVSLNVDGLQFSNGSAFQAALFDVGQVEVLRGPQALFYGKSSTGGVISFRTADPTDRLEVIGRGSYDFEARTRRIEGIVSGPVTSTLKLRLAAEYTKSDGYFYNNAIPAPGTGGRIPDHDRVPYHSEYLIRATALWNPTAQFNARLKFNYTESSTIDTQASQLKSCPNGPNFAPIGIPFIVGDDCVMNRTAPLVYLDPANHPAINFNGVPKTEGPLAFGTLELNYMPIQSLTLTSTTGYYRQSQETLLNATQTQGAGPAIGVPIYWHRHEFTEELRANSDFSGPLNFTAGGFYQDGHLENEVLLTGNTAYRLPPVLSHSDEFVDIKTYSLLGQLRWTIVPGLELAAGGRWTDETRRENAFIVNNGVHVPIPLAVEKIHSSNFAPEATITYKPSSDVTLFASYKQAYKSGSFGLGAVPAPGDDTSFGDERVKGFEGGVKARLLDRRMLVNFAAYHYDYRGLQVGAIAPPKNGLTETRTVNAGHARTYGVDFEVDYSPPSVDGLDLHASANWNKARYLTLTNIPCWGGQTIAMGCDQNFNPATGLFTAQDLSGTPMIRAPEWQAAFGFDYEIPFGEGMRVIFSNNNTYTSKYVTFLAIGRPNNDQFQSGFMKADFSVALRGRDDRWEVALIGKNLNDKVVGGLCNPAGFPTGVLFGTVLGLVTTGGTTSGPAGIDYVNCNSVPGREVWIRLEARY